MFSAGLELGPLCHKGTARILVEQAARLGYGEEAEKVGLLVAAYRSPAHYMGAGSLFQHDTPSYGHIDGDSDD